MVKGKTSNGFEFEIDEGRLKSRRFLKLMANMQRLAKAKDDNPEVAADLLLATDDYEIFIFGSEKEQERFLDHCDEVAGGYASPEAVQAELEEIISAINKKDTGVKN